MPNFDGTGPFNMGVNMGKGFGPCGLGSSLRKRYGVKRGMGRYFSFSAPQGKKEQLEVLKDYKKALQEELEDIEKELSKQK
ncbi:DUF5320 domain-containing protein [Patescibacteria group bacterium]